MTGFLVTQHDEDLDYLVDIRGCTFSGPDARLDEGHIAIYKERIEIKDLTLLPGRVDGWDAFKWGLNRLWVTAVPWGIRKILKKETK